MSDELRHARRRSLTGIGLAAMLTLGGCTVTQVETPNPAAIPTGPLTPQAEEATGEVVEVGQGQALDLGWRYAIYPSRDGWCTQLEMASLTSTGCGDPLPTGENAFGSVSVGELEPGGVTTVDGIVTADTATVWLLGEDGGRAPATLMSLEPAGLDARAFVGFAPPDVTLTHLMAVAANGDVLETYELP